MKNIKSGKAIRELLDKNKICIQDKQTHIKQSKNKNDNPITSVVTEFRESLGGFGGTMCQPHKIGNLA